MWSRCPRPSPDARCDASALDDGALLLLGVSRGQTGDGMIRWLAAVLLAFTMISPAAAQDRVRLGYGLLFSNDEFGDGGDRWQTGSLSVSRVWGPAWQGQAPARLGEVLEFRWGGQIASPESLTNPSDADRRYAGLLRAGLHTHAHRSGFDIALGADLVLTGPVTGLDGFQDALHDVLDGPRLSDSLQDSQIGDGVYPTVLVEVARPFAIAPDLELRPFVEAQAGIETFARLGVDLSIGTLGQGELFVRAPVTGQRYRVVRQEAPGLRFIMGADVAHVFDSALLPGGGNVLAEDTRVRARAGLHWQGRTGESIFYGLTWLSEEFEGQRESQLIGSLQFRIRF